MPPQNSDGLVFLAPVIDRWTPVQLEIDHDKFGDCWWQIYIAATPNENDRAIGLAMFTTKDEQEPASDDLTRHQPILWAAQPATRDPLTLYRMGLLVKALPEKWSWEFFPGVLAALINPTHPQFTYHVAKVRQAIGPDKFAAILSCDARPALPLIRVMRAYGIQPDLRGMTRAMVAGQLPWTKYIRSQGILHPQDLADRSAAKKTLLVAYQPWIEAFLASQDKPSTADMKQEEAYFKDRLEEEIVAEYIRGLGDEDTDGISSSFALALIRTAAHVKTAAVVKQERRLNKALRIPETETEERKFRITMMFLYTQMEMFGEILAWLYRPDIARPNTPSIPAWQMATHLANMLVDWPMEVQPGRLPGMSYDDEDYEDGVTVSTYRVDGDLAG